MRRGDVGRLSASSVPEKVSEKCGSKFSSKLGVLVSLSQDMI